MESKIIEDVINDILWAVCHGLRLLSRYGIDVEDPSDRLDIAAGLVAIGSAIALRYGIVDADYIGLLRRAFRVNAIADVNETYRSLVYKLNTPPCRPGPLFGALQASFPQIISAEAQMPEAEAIADVARIYIDGTASICTLALLEDPEADLHDLDCNIRVPVGRRPSVLLKRPMRVLKTNH